MMAFCRIILLTAVVLTLPGCGPSRQPAPPVYHIGYMICNNAQETLDRFAPLTAWLSRQTGLHLTADAIDTLDFSNQVDKLHFTHTNSLLYIMLHRNHGVEVMAVEKRGELGNRSRGIIAALKKSGIKTIDDLRDKTMIFGPMLAPTSYLSQLYVLTRAGFDIDRDLALYNFPRGSFKHEKVIYGVRFGRYDAGAFPYLDFEIMAQQGKIDRDEFTIIAQGPLIPYCNFAATQTVDDDVVRKLTRALLSLTPEDTVEYNGQRLLVLERAQLQGLTAASDSDFDLVREMARATNMPPYQHY